MRHLRSSFLVFIFLFFVAGAQAQSVSIPSQVLSAVTAETARPAQGTSSFLFSYKAIKNSYPAGPISLKSALMMDANYQYYFGVAPNSRDLLDAKPNSKALIYVAGLNCNTQIYNGFWAYLLSEVAKVERSFTEVAFDDNSSDRALPYLVGYLQAVQAVSTYNACMTAAFNDYSLYAIKAKPVAKRASVYATPAPTVTPVATRYYY